MIKTSVTYKNYNDQSVTRQLVFHFKVSEMMSRLDLADKYEDLQAVVDEEKRELTTPEKQRILDHVKELIDLSYGELDEDGERFRQTPELLEAFKDSAAYDTFLVELFTDTTRAAAFMGAVMPSDLIEKARVAHEAQLAQDAARKAPQDRLPKQVEASTRPFEQVAEVDTEEETVESLRAKLAAAEANHQG